MRKPSSWIVALLLASLAAALLWGFTQRRALDRERVGAAADRQAFVDLEGKLTVVEQARLESEATLHGQVDSNIRRMFPESRSATATATIDKFNAAVDRDPVWGPFYRKLERRRVLSRYGILFSALNLPADKLGPVEDLLVERAITSRYLVHQFREAGRKFNSPEVVAAVARATDEIDLKILKLVGADVAGKLKEWNSAIYSYGDAPDGPVAQDAVTLRDAGFKPGTDQLVRLALIRYEVYVLNPEARSGSGADVVDPKTGLTRLETELFAREAAVLPPAEVAVLRDWAIEENRARAVVNSLRTRFHVETERGTH